MSWMMLTGIVLWVVVFGMILWLLYGAFKSRR